MSLLGLASGFLWLSPSFRGTVLGGPGQAMFLLGQYSPWSYITLALTLIVFAVKSLTPAKPQWTVGTTAEANKPSKSKGGRRYVLHTEVVMEIPRFDSSSTNIGVNLPPPSKENDVAVRDVAMAVHEVNKSELMGEGRQLTFSRDPETHRAVIQIVDDSTGDVIDQIPAEALLRLAQQLQ